MQIAIKYQDGERARALLLSAGKNRLRVAIQGTGDTEEWARLDGCWRDEGGRTLDIEALVVLAGIDYSGLCDAFPRTASAGRLYN